jgi:DNA segregation ATPase FtsK/SpoIIIE-like protein
MLRAGESHFKVGIASNVLKRVQAIQTSNPVKIEVVTTRPVQNAEVVEHDLHVWLKEFRTNGGTEWFELTAEQALGLVTKIGNIELSADLADYLAVRNLALRVDKLDEKLRGVMEHLRLIPSAEEIIMREKAREEKAIEEDELIETAIKLVQHSHRASASMLQRRLKVGYSRAARLLDALHERGVVGPTNGALPREVFYPPAAPSLLESTHE